MFLNTKSHKTFFEYEFKHLTRAKKSRSPLLPSAPSNVKEYCLFESSMASPACPSGKCSTKVKKSMECLRNDNEGRTERLFVSQ